MSNNHCTCSYYCDKPERILAQRDELRERCDRQAAEIERLRADAERYRWLRTADSVPISPQAARDPVAYDAAIDAAMAKQKEGLV
jgi:hypothetical protein